MQTFDGKATQEDYSRLTNDIDIIRMKIDSAENEGKSTKKLKEEETKLLEEYKKMNGEDYQTII